MIIKKISANFTTITNDILRNSDLTIEARGAYAYCLSLPSDWEFSIFRMATDWKCSHPRVTRILNELSDYGLIERKYFKDEKGYKRQNIVIYDMQTKNPSVKNLNKENLNKENFNNITKEIPIQKKEFTKEKIYGDLEKKQSENSDLNNLDCKENFNFNSENENLDLGQNENSLINEQKQPLKAKTEPKEYKDTTEQEKTLKTHGNAKFEKPSLDEIKKYAYIAGLKVDCERFYDYYESNGWLVGNKAKMRDWKASLRNWARNENKFGNNQNANQNANKSLSQRLAEQEARILAKYEAQDNLIDCEILGA